MRSTSWTIAAALSAALCACGGGSSDGGVSCTAVPITITQGTWCITINGTSNNCGSPIVPPYTATFTQSSSDLSATSLGATYTGRLCGPSGAMTGTTATASVTVQVEFSDASHASGTSTWTAKSGPCTGADTFTAHAGGCP